MEAAGTFPHGSPLSLYHSDVEPVLRCPFARFSFSLVTLFLTPENIPNNRDVHPAI